MTSGLPISQADLDKLAKNPFIRAIASADGTPSSFEGILGGKARAEKPIAPKKTKTAAKKKPKTAKRKAGGAPGVSEPTKKKARVKADPSARAAQGLSKANASLQQANKSFAHLVSFSSDAWSCLLNASTFVLVNAKGLLKK